MTLGGTSPDSYVTVSGTSIAAPHVSGAMALLLSASPQLSVADLETSLAQSAVDLGMAGLDNNYGYGLANVNAAYNYLMQSASLLQVTVTGKGRGTVTSDVAGILCHGACSRKYIAGTKVTLTASPEAGSSFAGWSGDCSGRGEECHVAMDRERNVSAEFKSFPWILLLPAAFANIR